jgi:hypothetical protein
MAKYAYANNTGKDIRGFETVIMAAIENGGVFADDFSDIFTLTPTPAGSAAEYILNFAD